VETQEARQVLEETMQRVRSVGSIQERLHDSGAIGASVDLAHYLPELAEDVLNAEGLGTVRLKVEAEPVRASVSQAATLGLMVNELLTNAVKYAFDEDGSGDLSLTLRPVGDGRAEIVVQDSGPGFPPEALNGGAGRAGSRGRSLVDALARKTPAVLTRENDGGARVTVRFVIDEAV
jgi:two-component sensor histidine kinase